LIRQLQNQKQIGTKSGNKSPWKLSYKSVCVIEANEILINGSMQRYTREDTNCSGNRIYLPEAARRTVRPFAITIIVANAKLLLTRAHQLFTPKTEREARKDFALFLSLSLCYSSTSPPPPSFRLAFHSFFLFLFL